MNKEQRNPVVRELAGELYKARTGSKDAPVNTISKQDYHMALVALRFFEDRERWEYGTICRKDGEDSTAFPVWWSTNLKEVKDDLDWHVQHDGFKNREWRIVKRRVQGPVEELDDAEELALEEMDNG